jgi:putative transposase
MSENINVVPLRQPNEVDDPLTSILRSGARQLLAQAVEMEAEAFLLAMKGLKLPDGRDRLVRHGHGPERTIQTGMGQNAPNLSPAVISRLTAEWQGEYERWQKRDLSARRYVYVWADGVFLQARMEDHGECMLVLIGATPEGKKELIGFQVGARESAQSWRELLVEVKSRGLTIAPEIAVGDGALGFWKALDEVFPGTRHQRCWVHKTANVLNKVTLSVQTNMKKDLREIYLAPNRASAEVAINVFAEKYGAKYDKAVECLTKDREALLALYEFPAEHWDHLRTFPHADLEADELLLALRRRADQHQHALAVILSSTSLG